MTTAIKHERGLSFEESYCKIKPYLAEVMAFLAFENQPDNGFGGHWLFGTEFKDITMGQIQKIACLFVKNLDVKTPAEETLLPAAATVLGSSEIFDLHFGPKEVWELH